MGASYGLINYGTGQVTDINDGDQVRVIRKSSLEAYKKYIQTGYISKDTDYLEYEVYAKVNVKEFNLWLSKLNVYEKAFLMSVIPYVSYTSCELTYKNHVQIDNEALLKITGLPRSTLYRTIKSLVEKDILYKGRNSKGIQYFVNPWLIMKGVVSNKTLKVMFKNYRIQSLNGKRWGDLKEFQR